MTETTGIRSRTVTANGLRMHVTEAGAGAPVLLLHGFPESSREWATVMAALADRAHLIAPDLRGAGQTDAPATGYDAATVARDVVALLDALRSTVSTSSPMTGVPSSGSTCAWTIPTASAGTSPSRSPRRTFA